jgi:hypothetical protein
MGQLLRVAILPARSVSWAIAVLHSWAAAMCSIALPPMPALLMTLIILISAVHSIRRHGTLCSPDSIVLLELGADTIGFRSKSGEKWSGVVGAPTFVSRLLTIVLLRLKDSRQHRCLVITNYNTVVDEFRALRVALRWGR